MLSFLILDSNKHVTNGIPFGISSEIIKKIDTNLKLTMSNLANGRVILKFDNSVLVQKNVSPRYSNFVLNLCIVYELNTSPRNPTNNVILKNCLFGGGKLTRNAGKCKFTSNGWRIGFDGNGNWSFDNGTAINVVSFSVDNISLSHIDNPIGIPQKSFLVLGKGSTECINGSVDAVERKYY